MAVTPIARYLLNEASSGKSTPTIVDDTGNGNDLTVTWDDHAESGFESVQVGWGLSARNAPAELNGCIATLSDISTNGTIGSTLDGATKLTLALVFDVTVGHANMARLFHIGTDSGDGDFGIVVDASEYLYVRYDRESGGTGQQRHYINDIGSTDNDGVIYMHVVVDTTLADGAQRDVVYYNSDTGANLVTKAVSVSTAQTQNLALDAINSTDRSICLLNRPDRTRGIQGKMYYCELFLGAMSPHEVMEHQRQLKTYGTNERRYWYPAV